MADFFEGFYMSHKISAYIIVFNDVEKIEAAINSVMWADEVVVVDSHSTDGTTELAQKLGAKVVHEDFNGFGDLRNKAITHCQYDWIFSLDSDERCTIELRDEILNIVNTSISQLRHRVFFVPRKNYFMGKWIKHSGWYPNYRQPQLFFRGCMSYTLDSVHEGYVLHSGETEIPEKDLIGYLQQAAWQMPFQNLDQLLQKANRYSTLGVKKLIKKKSNPSLSKALFRGVWAFLKHYILKKGFLDGWPGFIIALGNFEGTFYRYAKHYECSQQWQEPKVSPLLRES